MSAEFEMDLELMAAFAADFQQVLSALELLDGDYPGGIADRADQRGCVVRIDKGFLFGYRSGHCLLYRQISSITRLSVRFFGYPGKSVLPGKWVKSHLNRYRQSSQAQHDIPALFTAKG